MNKTLTANIGGRVFYIEEQAYERLNRYLQAIRSYLGSSEGTDEVLSDVEGRIAELLQARITPANEVITMSDVGEVIAIMGRPEEFGESQSDGTAERTYKSRTTAQEKRMFRDPDNQVIAGVCGGIGAYFGWEPVVLRLLFVIAFIMFGSGVLVYIILALVIPKARTTSEKLQMRGEPVTVENISRKVSESFDEVKENVQDFGKKNFSEERVQSFGRRLGDVIGDIGAAIGRALAVIFSVVARLIGAVALFAAVLFIIAVLASILGWSFGATVVQTDWMTQQQITALGKTLLVSGTERWVFITGLLLVLIIPATALMLAGLRLLTGRGALSPYAGTTMAALWMAGMVMVTVTALMAQDAFRIDAEYTSEIPLQQPTGNTLYLESQTVAGTRIQIRSGWRNMRDFYPGAVTFPGLDSTEVMYMGQNRLTIAMNSSDSLFRLESVREARGSNHKEAVQFANDIRTYESSRGDTLLIAPWFAVPTTSKMRFQQVSYTLYVPVGKKVHLGRSTKDLLHDVPNVSNTWDADMPGKTWVMTPAGLECLGCTDPQTII